MVSMKDIAAACGVSIATVSKALNDHSDVGEDTKVMIRRKAKEMGYYPNAQARALKTNRTYNIGVLFVDEARSGLTHDYFSYVLDSFKRTVEESGYDITFINSSKKGRNQLSVLDHCKYRGFDGVMIACVDFYDPQVMELIQSDIPVVTIDHTFEKRISIISDNIRGMEELVRYVYSMGHRKIAYIHGVDSAVTQKRLGSFFRTVENLGLIIPDEYIKEAAYRDTVAAYDATNRLLDLNDPPTCILYPDDFACYGGMNAIRARGLRIPEDVSVAGYDGIRVGRHIAPRLTTLKQDTECMGCEAAKKLISIIERPKTTIVEPVVVGGTVYEGETVRRIDN
ncbi:MAG: LacI family DNA-binding transcriptional regulator [Lachnospiraceae bacterium]|nr:LacI family DNA-binding transcriptional regulator [Lachnospiraceae bacterium]